MKHITFFTWLIIVLNILYAQENTKPVPGIHWQTYKNVADAGFSSEKLEATREHFKSSNASALFVVHRGTVLLSLGEPHRRFMAASIRKSFLSALIGKAVESEEIDLTKNLAELGIDDITPLSGTEKTATVEDLLSARSGIYLPAAFSPRGMAKNLPERGSYMPGEHWYYNNWDFNTLVTIYEQETGRGIFTDFEEQITTLLQMEDFSKSHTYYCYEPEKSKHPAYLFRMSARDMARFGLLYLYEGKWGTRQIIPKNWVHKSTSSISKDTGPFAGRGEYGYLWWISPPFKGNSMFFASGSGGQKIAILPEAELVIVQLTNTYQFRNVRHGEFLKVVRSIISAKVSPSIENPQLIKASQPESTIPNTVTISEEDLTRIEGNYTHPQIGKFAISVKDNKPLLEVRIGIFDMLPTGKLTFWVPDIDLPVVFEAASVPEERRKIKSILDDNREAKRLVFYF